MNISTYVFIWALLAVILVAMAAYRYLLVRHEDATLDVFESSTVAAEQTKVFRRAHGIERLGKPLTLVVLIYGLVLAVVYFYHVWQVSIQIPK